MFLGLPKRCGSQVEKEWPDGHRKRNSSLLFFGLAKRALLAGSFAAMAQTLDLIPWPPDASPIYAAPAVLIPLEPKKTMLAGVKEHLYHPCLPTLRRMDMDTVANRLTDQHSRTSTTCSKEDFQRATFTVAGVPSRPVPSLGMSELRQSLAGRYRAGKLAPLPPSTNQEEWPSYTRAMQDWSRFVSAAGELALPSHRGKVLGFSCYAVRYLKPDVTQTWRYCLNQNPSLDRYGPKPLPYNTVNTYRSFGTAHRRLAAGENLGVDGSHMEKLLLPSHSSLGLGQISSAVIPE